ncbi:hypothetical protein ERX37_05980 [Macrococcus hajekii]|uniref:Uncharacterized protein n=1 Tax=Macrococcus hajekii TaxID=198482 RepID=A0A4R6BJE8_9STAP|nr:hypothetical protein [Macrococcus hajekii]TDM01758.1 hypothetical protein ERX37_05980 [Macrococcus hajekii]GGB07191.1 hypothetical protein GCM10007190_14030 [Macrococcus hajekii]
MRSEEILLSQLPEALRGLIEEKDIEGILNYFFDYDIEERRIADALSRYAIATNSSDLHKVAADVYMHVLPYLDDAFQLVFYHQWRVLEMDHFNDTELMTQFLDYQSHPDFDMIPDEYYDYVKKQLSTK